MVDPVAPPEEETAEAIAARVRPGFTLLHGYVEDDDSGNPLPGATVRVANGNAKAESDSKGHYYLSVATPKPESPRGMGTDTLICEKSGYKTEIRQNIGITDDDMGPVIWGLEKGSGQIIPDMSQHAMGTGLGEEPRQSARPGATSISRELLEWLSRPVTESDCSPEHMGSQERR